MRWPRLRLGLGSGILLRALVRELGGIRAGLDRQADLLERWAQAAGIPPAQAPGPSAAPPEDGVSFLDPIERGLVEAYITTTRAGTGRDPTEDEILAYLAEEKTEALHWDLQQAAAEQDLARLQRRAR